MNFAQLELLMAADVEKAFFQITIHEEDRDGLRLLWQKELPKKDSELSIVDTWRMKTFTFGTKPSSCLFVSTIH